MSTTIQIKRSSTASAVPLSGDLAVGELAVNLADKRLFAKQADGTIIELSTNPTDLDAATLRIDGVEITASATELNKLDGFTGSTTELNTLDGLTASTAEINTLDGITATTAELNKLDGYTGSTAELNILDGVTATTAELNKLDGFTGTVADLNYAKDLRATGVTTTEFDKLDGLTATTAELNYTDGVTSNIQTQLNGKAATTTSPTITLAGDLSGSATLTNLGSATLTATVADDSHNHVISNVDGLQTALDSKANLSGANFTGSVDVTGTVTADGLTVESNNNSVGAVTTLSNTNTSTDGNTVIGNIIFENNDDSANTTNAEIKALSAGTAGQTDVYVKTGSGGTPSNTAKFAFNGDVSFYEDTGTTAKFVWDSSAEGLSIGGTALGRFNVSDGTNPLVVDCNATYNEIQSYNRPLQINRQGNNTILNSTSGNVGIGTDSPSADAKLVISEDATNGIEFSTSAIANENRMLSYDRNAGSEVGMTYRASEHKLQTNGIERMRIDSSGNVGIGTAVPTTALTVQGGVNSSHATFSGQAGRGLVIGTQNTLNNDDGVSYDAQTSSGKHLFKTNGSERARIDSSGNLLVGTTDSTLWNNGAGGNTGVLISGSLGNIQVARSGSSTIDLNRLDSDGEIVIFRKDGAPVGSIGSYNGEMFVSSPAGGDCAFRMGYNAIKPATVTGANADASHDLGEASGRWRNLYLSGGVYLGGTGAANKLDDYEEGDWTPAVGVNNFSVSPTVLTGNYTKVGRLVTVRLSMSFPSSTTMPSYSTVSGLPFTTTGQGGAIAAADTVFSHARVVASGSNLFFTYLEGTASLIDLVLTYQTND